MLLTAAHCTDGTLGKTLVTFSSVIAENPPSPFPAAADPGKGYTQKEIEAAGYLSGMTFTHPDYSNFTDKNNWNDGVWWTSTSRSHHRAGQSRRRSAHWTRSPPRSCGSTLFTAVGYGTEVRKADSGPQKPTAMSYPLIRRYVDMPGQKVTPQIIQTNGNDKDPFGTGGTCFGDSGGPLFLGNQIVGVTSYTYNNVCRYLGGYQRVDITVARGSSRPQHLLTVSHSGHIKFLRNFDALCVGWAASTGHRTTQKADRFRLPVHQFQEAHQRSQHHLVNDRWKTHFPTLITTTSLLAA